LQGIVALARTCGAVYGGPVLAVGDAAPDFAIGDRSLHQILEEREAVVFFFPRAFTPG
jgi:peroxiredoxin